MRNQPAFRIALLLALCLLPARPSWAWFDTGHKIIAFIAWDDLTPQTRAAVTELLKHHPLYEKDLLADLPAGATPDESARHAFVVAATWPDAIRAQAHPMHTLYNHPQWHFIDIPFDDGAVPPPAAPKAPGPQNAIEALIQCTSELKTPAGAGDKKAIDLCWIEHIVGDIHQPLHTASLFSPEFPKGDSGGNSEFVLRDPPYPDSRANLHLIWDSLPGDFHSEFIDRYLADGLRADPNFSRDKFKPLLAKTDFMEWAKESHALAVEDAYLNGHLEASASRGAGRGSPPTPGLPPGYLEKAEHVAMQQVALAGYRLADLLNSILDPKPR